jgi:hypothetical protein
VWLGQKWLLVVSFVVFGLFALPIHKFRCKVQDLKSPLCKNYRASNS